MPGIDATRAACPEDMWPLDNSTCIETVATRDLDPRAPERYRDAGHVDGMTSVQAEVHCAVRGRRLCRGDELLRWTRCLLHASFPERGRFEERVGEGFVFPTTGCLGPEPDLEIQDGLSLAQRQCEVTAEFTTSTYQSTEREGRAIGMHQIISIDPMEDGFLNVVLEHHGCGPYVRCCWDR